MKKYITLAALLAAGTACAHAEVLFEGFSTGVSTAGWGTTSKYTQEFTGIDFSSDGEYEISFTWEVTVGSNHGTMFELCGTDFSLVLGSAYNTTALAVGTYAGNAFSGIGNTVTDLDTNNDTADFSNVEVLNSEKGMAVGTYNFSLNLKTFADASDVLTVSVEKGDSQWELTKSVYEFEGSGTTARTGFQMYGAQGHGLVKASNLKISSVPEPSAFGMLAGLGALALVASRRRRK